MNRRGFLGSILAAAAAPAIVRADSLMRIIPREITLLTPVSTPLPAAGAFENPTFTGTTIVAISEWSVDGVTWQRVGPEGTLVLPAHALGPNKTLRLRCAASAPDAGFSVITSHR